MDVSQDYEDLFKILNAYSIKYLVVGAHAVIYYTEPRYTKDIDVWIIPEANKPERIFQALKEYRAPLHDLSPKDFSNKNLILQIGVAPVRIDIMMDVPGVSFKNAWRHRVKTKYGSTTIHLLGREDLLRSKHEAGRPQDQIDIEKIKKFKK